MNIFEQAARGKLRFDSQVGSLTTEQVWDLPLTARGNAADLDKLARAVNSELKVLQEGSFVKVEADPRMSEAQLKLDILKHVIADKIARAKAAETAYQNAERKRKLLSALASKEEADLAGMSREDIESEIAKLDS